MPTSWHVKAAEIELARCAVARLVELHLILIVDGGVAELLLGQAGNKRLHGRVVAVATLGHDLAEVLGDVHATATHTGNSALNNVARVHGGNVQSLANVHNDTRGDPIRVQGQ